MWTSEQVLALSPDANSTKNGKALATVGKWPLLGRNEQAVWGECKGSGKKPYRTQIDLSEPAFRCSCPSRKFPCKHALGLFLLLAEQPGAIATANPPDWVNEWLGKRSQTAQRQQAKKAKAADPIAQAQRTQQRAAKVAAGLADLDQWLQDIVRQGLAALPNQPYKFWDQAAARLVDAQAPGLARRVRNLAGVPHSGRNWPERMLQDLGHLHLLIQAYGRLDQLPPLLQAEVKTQIGWPQTREDLLQRADQGDPLVDRVKDTWQVLGKQTFEDDGIKGQRTWLWGQRTEQAALVLDFAHGSQSLNVSLIPGTCFDGELIFYPGTGQRRAFVASRESVTGDSADMASAVTGQSIEFALQHYAQALGANPWIELFPLTLADVQLLQQSAQQDWWLQDRAGCALPLSPRFHQTMELLSLSGGHPITVFGEWDGNGMLPLSVVAANRFRAVGG